jgi:hypothetical protein
MYNFHTTKDGERIMICMMEDRHLINTIKLYLRKIREEVAKINGAPLVSDPILLAVHPVDTAAIKRQAQSRVKALSEALPPYIAEATLRGLTDLFVEDLQSTYGRSSKMDSGSAQALIEAGADNDDDDDDYDYDGDRRGYGYAEDFHYECGDR